MSQRRIARSCGLGKTTVTECLSRFEASGLSWPAAAELDEASLRAVAERTGGRYFRARDSAELTQIYALLDELEPVSRDKQVFRPRLSLYPWPLGAALALAALMLAWPLLRRPRDGA